MAIPPSTLGGGGGGALELVESKDFSVAGTSHSFAGIDGDTDEVYQLEYRIIKDTASAMLVTIQPNGITTNQDSYERYDGTSSGSAHYTDLRIVDSGVGSVGDVHGGRLWFHSKSGAHRVGQSLWSEVAAGTYILQATLVWREIVTNITSLDIVSDVALGIGPGSFLRLYKLNKV